MGTLMDPARRQALRARAEVAVAGLESKHFTAEHRAGRWWMREREYAQDVLDLLAALEAAEQERDRLRQALQEAHARFGMIASSPMVSEGVERFAGSAAVSIRAALGVEGAEG